MTHFWRLRYALVPLVCRLRGHDWHYFSLTNFDGTPANFRCCLRCERSEELGNG